MIRQKLTLMILFVPLFANASTLYINEAFDINNITGINGELGSTPGSTFQSVNLEFTASGLAMANEVTSVPASDQDVGNTLTYNLSAGGQQFDVVVAAPSSDDFVNHDGNRDKYWEDYVSIGRMDFDKDDDLEFVISSANVYGFSFSVFDNTSGGGEQITIELSDGSSQTIATSDMYATNSDSWGVPLDTYQFYSSGATIASVTFDEDSGGGGDNMGLHSMTLSGIDFAPVPVPAAVWLFGSALISLVGIKRRSSR